MTDAEVLYGEIAKHGNLLLSGIVGSQAYGLANEQSDADRLGIFAAPTLGLCGLSEPKESHVYSEPADAAFHEVGKFARLALACNPTVLELLWLDDYELTTPLGRKLIDIRSSFLSAPRVYDAYLGYARSQFRKLQMRADGTFSSDTANRSAKHARHMARLINQGLELYTTGHLTIRVQDPDWYRDFSRQSPDEWTQWFASMEHEFATATTQLPYRPNADDVEQWLNLVRIENLPSGITRRIRFWLDEDESV